MSGLLNQCESAVVLLPHSLLGSEVGARIAFRIGCPVVMNCESILLSGGEVVTSRACFGGRLKEDVRVQAPHTVVTVAANASLPPAPGDAYGQGDCWKVEELDFALPDGPGLIECVRRELDAEPLGPSLETANVVVGGGRGLGGAQGFVELACDLGWCPKSWQIGLSGRSIRADWYITFGISGASHHMAGCAQAGKLVAINNDKSAEIFRHATYGVVADARSVLQELVRLFESVEAAVQSCRAG
jgi:electron transfer flavoprotein alpha subunit